MRPYAPGRALAPGVVAVAHLHRSRALDVYDAWCERRACAVAVKLPRPDRRADRRVAAALRREGRLLQRLCHPCIVRGYETHDGPPPAVVLETVGGETLARLLERRRARRLPATEIAHLGLHLAGALRYLHGEGLLHLDVKPSNIVAEAGRAKLLDLSIARPPGGAPAGRGTWCNMAPEQARGGDLGPPADVWGLGTVLYEAATGCNPFAEREDLDHPQLTVRAAPVRRSRRAPAALADLIDGCLEPAPAARPGLDEVLAVLAGVTRPAARASRAA